MKKTYLFLIIPLSLIICVFAKAEDPVYLVLTKIERRVVSVHHNPLFEEFLPSGHSVHKVKEGFKLPDQFPLWDTSAHLDKENEVVTIAIPSMGIYKSFYDTYLEQTCEEAVKAPLFIF